MNNDFVQVSWEDFRQKLAFPMGEEHVSSSDVDDAFNYLVKLCSVLPLFYGDSLDRLNLWGRIDSALSVASSKCSRPDEICDCLLTHICAEASRVAESKDLKPFLEPSVKIAAIRQVIATRRLLVICKARTLWMEARS